MGEVGEGSGDGEVVVVVGGVWGVRVLGNSQCSERKKCDFPFKILTRGVFMTRMSNVI